MKSKAAGPDAGGEVLPIHTGFRGGNMDSEQSRNAPLEVRVSLNGMDPEDALCVSLAADYAGLSVSALLDRLFPTAEEDQGEVRSMLDLRANPDLPDIYAVFLEVFDEWRKGRCALAISVDGGVEVSLAGRVLQHLEPVQTPLTEHSSRRSLKLNIEQRYRAVEHGTQHGIWEGKAELLEWLRSLTVLYFLDKHEFRISASPSGDVGPEILSTATALSSKNLISPSEDTQTFAITEEGRRFIGKLLAETESYIDQYDHFKDAEFHLNSGVVAFGSGRGIDLRVQVYIAEGLDPTRTVFLLRLYDGSLDRFADTWMNLINGEGFFDGILEPVVNRDEVDEASIGWIVESGYSHLDEREERARELEARRRIVREVRLP